MRLRRNQELARLYRGDESLREVASESLKPGDRVLVAYKFGTEVAPREVREVRRLRSGKVEVWHDSGVSGLRQFSTLSRQLKVENNDRAATAA